MAEWFVSKVEGIENPNSFEWSPNHIESKGWSGSVLLNPGARSLFLEQIRQPSKWSNEIHVLWPGNWRETQVAAYLDDGNVYSTYGQRMHGVPVFPWRTPSSKAGVKLVLDEKANTAKVTFYCGEVKVTSLKVFGDLRNVGELRLEVRAHPHGALRILPH